MHLVGKATTITKRARSTGRTTMTVDTLRVITFRAHATRGETSNVTHAGQLARRRFMIVGVRTIGSVTAVATEVMDVA